MNKNCLIIAGEKSGEEHCMSFLQALKKDVGDCHFWGVGGDDMKKEGVELLYHIKEFCSWGFSEVIFKLPFYFRAFNRILAEVDKRQCKTAILIDFQDFNLRLAQRLKEKGVEVLYYVAPQAWAWKEHRVSILEKSVHTLFTILPFEKQWFTQRGVKRVVGVDHPVWLTYKDLISDSALGIESKNTLTSSKVIQLLLLPGSRNFEVKNLLPVFIEASKKLNKRFKVELSIVISPNVDPQIYAPYLGDIHHKYQSSELSAALIKADFSIAASGTVTLTTALFEVPTVIAYKTSSLNAFIYSKFIKYRGPIGLVNIVHGKKICPEFLQEKAEPMSIASALDWWMGNYESFVAIKKELAKTKKLVRGELASVSEYIAKVIKYSYGA